MSMNIGKRETSVGASVNASGNYLSGHSRVINGTRYAFVHRVHKSGKGQVEVYRGDEINPCKVFTGKVRQMPGLMDFSKRLGKLISF